MTRQAPVPLANTQLSRFHRWTLSGLTLDCTSLGFEVVRSGVHMGPGSAVAVILQQFFALFAPGRFLRKIVRVGMQFLLFWVKYLDYFLIHDRDAHVLASGCYCVAIKRANPVR